jgi:hypothetical protein
MAAFTHQGNIPGTHFCYRHSAAGIIMSVKNSYDPIGKKTLGLPACSQEHLKNMIDLNKAYLIHINNRLDAVF